MGDFVVILGTIGLLVIGYVCGMIGQKRHYRSIVEREKQLADILLFNEKIPPDEVAGQPFTLVSGSVVMSSDYFRQFLAGIKMFFGGRINSYEAMIDRGRREAILRMKEEARRAGAQVIFNVRLETSTLSYSEGRNNGLPCLELIAYGTAWKLPAEKNVL